MIDFLQWLAERPRSYAETIDVWKSSCPRLMHWEDAIADGLVRVRDGAVHLTDAGEARLAPASNAGAGRQFLGAAGSKSTSSRYTISAASPWRGPSLTIRE
jgi:hypothetical protein